MASGAGDAAADADRIGGVATGDAQAFRDLYARYGADVARFCAARLRDPGTAADAAQEVWIAVWRGAAGYAHRGSVAGWIFGIAARRVADARRRGQRQAQPESAAETQADPRDPIAASEARLDVWGALDALPGVQQDTVLMAYVFGLSCAEIAEATDVPEGTVKSRLFHARRALAQTLTGGRRA